MNTPPLAECLFSEGQHKYHLIQAGVKVIDVDRRTAGELKSANMQCVFYNPERPELIYTRFSTVWKTLSRGLF
jgi:hypothetical protein